jgi:hypothetical protein
MALKQCGRMSDMVVSLRPSFKILGARCVSSSTDNQESSSLDVQLCFSRLPNHVSDAIKHMFKILIR